MDAERRDSRVLKGLDIRAPLNHFTVSPPMDHLPPNSGGSTTTATAPNRISLPGIDSLTSVQQCAASIANERGMEPRRQSSQLEPLSIPRTMDTRTDQTPQPPLQKPAETTTAPPSSLRAHEYDDYLQVKNNPANKGTRNAHGIQDYCWDSLKRVKKSTADDRKITADLERLKGNITRNCDILETSLCEEFLWDFISSPDGRKPYGDSAQREIDGNAEWKYIGITVKKTRDLRKQEWENEGGRSKFLSHGNGSAEFGSWLNTVASLVSYPHARRLANRRIYQRLGQRKQGYEGTNKNDFVLRTADLKRIAMDIKQMKSASTPRPDNCKELSQIELTRMNGMLDKDSFVIRRHIDFVSPYAKQNAIVSNNSLQHAITAHEVDTKFTNCTNETVQAIIPESSSEINNTRSASKQLEVENETSQSPPRVPTETDGGSRSNKQVPAPEREDSVMIDLTQDSPDEGSNPTFQPAEGNSGNQNSFIDMEPDISAFVYEDMLDVPETNEINEDTQPVATNDRPTMFSPPAAISQTYKEFELPRDGKEQTPSPTEGSVPAVSNNVPPDDPKPCIPAAARRALPLKLRARETQRMGRIFLHCRNLGLQLNPNDYNQFFKITFARAHGYAIVAPAEIKREFNTTLINWPPDYRLGFLLMLKDNIIKIVKPDEANETQLPSFNREYYMQKIEEGKDGWEDEFGLRPRLEDLEAEYIASVALEEMSTSEDDTGEDPGHEEEQVNQANSVTEDNTTVEAQRLSRPRRQTRRVRRIDDSPDEDDPEEEEDNSDQSADEEPPSKRTRISGPTTRSSGPPPKRILESTKPTKSLKTTKQTKQTPKSSATLPQRKSTRTSVSQRQAIAQKASLPPRQAKNSEQVAKHVPEPRVTRQTTRTLSTSSASVSQIHVRESRRPTTSVRPLPSPSISATSTAPSRTPAPVAASMSRGGTASLNTQPPQTMHENQTPRSAKAIVSQITGQMTKLQEFSRGNAMLKQIVERPLVELTDRVGNWQKFAEAEDAIENLDVDSSLLDVIKGNLERLVDKELAEKGLFSSPQQQR